MDICPAPRIKSKSKSKCDKVRPREFDEDAKMAARRRLQRMMTRKWFTRPRRRYLPDSEQIPTMTIDSLPNDPLMAIFRYATTIGDILSARLVCARWHSLVGVSRLSSSPRDITCNQSPWFASELSSQILHFDTRHLNRDSRARLVGMPNLTHLTSDSLSSASSIISESNLSRVSTLSINFSGPLADFCDTVLPTVRKLVTLRTFQHGPRDFESLAKALPNLENGDFGTINCQARWYNYMFTTELPNYTLQLPHFEVLFPRLTSLSFSTQKLCPSTVKSILLLPVLETLSIRHCCALGGADIWNPDYQWGDDFCLSSTSLSDLTLLGNVQNLTLSMPRLNYLDVAACANLDVSACPSITYLSFGCSKVENIDEILQKVHEKTLRSLSLSWENGTIAKFVIKMPNLVNLTLVGQGYSTIPIIVVDTPLLKHLEANLDYRSSSPHLLNDGGLFLACPLVERVSFTGTPPLAHIPLLVCGIRSLHLLYAHNQRPHSAALITAFSNIPRFPNHCPENEEGHCINASPDFDKVSYITHLKIGKNVPDISKIIPILTKVMPNLVSLKLTVGDRDLAQEEGIVLSLPNIRKLSIKINNNVSVTFGHSHPKLTKLTIESYPQFDQKFDMCDLLELLPGLDSLYMLNTRFTQDVVVFHQKLTRLMIYNSGLGEGSTIAFDAPSLTSVFLHKLSATDWHYPTAPPIVFATRTSLAPRADFYISPNRVESTLATLTNSEMSDTDYPRVYEINTLVCTVPMQGFPDLY